MYVYVYRWFISKLNACITKWKYSNDLVASLLKFVDETNSNINFLWSLYHFKSNQEIHLLTFLQTSLVLLISCFFRQYLPQEQASLEIWRIIKPQTICRLHRKIDGQGQDRFSRKKLVCSLFHWVCKKIVQFNLLRVVNCELHQQLMEF